MESFVLMCGRLASKHDTALAHAMLHAVAVWMSGRGDDERRGHAHEHGGGGSTG